jgi:hypothetical protein
MAEYLSHVDEEPFDGILFATVQRQAGVNTVLFSDGSLVEGSDTNAFPLEYIDRGVNAFET